MPLVGEEFAGYRLVSVLGRGGMSTVFRAENPRLGNVIALKVFDPSLAADDSFRTRFLEESRIAASMNHPNVIPIHDMGSSDGLLYVAMRCVTGTDLQQMIKERGRLQPDTAVSLLEQAARALDAAHRRGLVHRDVKPGNLLVEGADEGSEPDHVYVTDFGISKHIGGRTGQSVGTIDYVAPEQIRGISVLGLADQYSLGCVLYECLTGRVPFEKDLDAAIIWAHVEEAPVMPTVLRPDLPPAIDNVFARVLAKRPGDRYESCKDFMAAARDALGSLADPLSPSETPRPPQAASGPVPDPAESGPVADPAESGPVADPAESEAAYQADAYAPQPPAYRPLELTHESASVFRAPTADWSAFTPAPKPPPLRLEDPPVPPGAPGGTRRNQDRSRDRGWLAAAGALLIAVGGTAAAVTIILTGGRSSPAAGSASAASMSPTAGGSARTGAAGAGGSAPSLAVPTVAGKIPVGQTPSYIQVAPNGKYAYITNPGARAVTVLNTANNQVSGTIKIPQGPPQFVSFSPDGRTAYVSVYNTRGSVHLVAFVDTATGTVTSTVSVNNVTPGPSTASPDGRYLYVPNHNMTMGGRNENLIDVIDTTAQKLISKIAVPPNPHWIVFGKNGQIYVTDHMSTTVTVLNARTNAIIKEIQVGETPHSIAISPDGKTVAVTSFNGNQVFLIDTATNQEVGTIPVGRNPLEIKYSPDGRYLFTANNEDNTVTVINAADKHVIARIPTGKAPTSISLLPNGRQAYVTDENDGTIEILNIPQ